MTDKFLGIERRRFSDAISLEELERHVEARIKEHMEKHAAAEAKMFETKFDELKVLFSSAFPDGPLKHYEYHEEQILYMKEQRAFYADLKRRSAFWILTLIIGATGMAVWEYIKVKLGVHNE